MDFPSYGDATVFDHLGGRCAWAIESPDDSVVPGCYHPVRPLGIALFYSVPHLVTSDPVQRAYLVLAINVLLLLAAAFALRSLLAADPRIAAAGLPSPTLGHLVFFPLLVNLLPHLPVTLSDLPAFTCSTLACAVAARILFPPAGAAAGLRWWWLAGSLAAGAVLLKQTYVFFALSLFLSLLLLAGRPLPPRQWLPRAGAFLVGASAMLLQVAYVAWNSGVLWLYDPAEVRVFVPDNSPPNVEAAYFNLPSPDGFLIVVTNDVDRLTFVAIKLFRGLYQLEFAVYGGFVNEARRWTLDGFDFVTVYAGVLAYLAIAFATILRGPKSLALLNLNGLAFALGISLLGHTEVRYYIWPRSAFLITLLFLAHSLARRLRARRVTAPAPAPASPGSRP